MDRRRTKSWTERKEAFGQEQVDGFARHREEPWRSRGERRGVLHSPRFCHGHEKKGEAGVCTASATFS
eukprot:scaffold3523_cov499-Pavlova_lutheri.AAC.1